MLETVTYQFSFPGEEFYSRCLKVVWGKPSRSPWLQRATKYVPFLGWLISKHLVTLHCLLIQEKLRQCGQTMVVPDCLVGLAEVFIELYNYWISPYTIFFPCSFRCTSQWHTIVSILHVKGPPKILPSKEQNFHFKIISCMMFCFPFVVILVARQGRFYFLDRNGAQRS